MSLYTTEVRFICEEAAGYEESQGMNSVSEILEKSWDKVIPQDWPIFDETYRATLCQKILKHYYTREIGFETVGLWKLKLETELNEIMPYYNELYKTKLMQFDPFRDVDYFKEHAGSGESVGNGTRETVSNINDTTETESGENTGVTYEGDSTANREDENSGWDLYADTPQGTLNGIISENYLTNARHTTNEGSSDQTIHEENEQNTEKTANSTTERTAENTANEETNNKINNTDEYLDHVYGKYNSRSYMSIVKEVREIIINIDLMIINDLKDLFFGLWR